MTATQKRPTEAWQSAKLFELGIGYVAVARFKGNGDAEIGVFLVDVFCLGAKNAFFTRAMPHEYGKILDRIFGSEERVALTPACARKLVEDAVTFGRTLGFAPHADYKTGCRVFGGIDPAECQARFTFGKDGKPLYVQGPNDSPEFVHRAMAILTARLGQEGFHYIVGAGGASAGEEEA